MRIGPKLAMLIGVATVAAVCAIAKPASASEGCTVFSDTCLSSAFTQLRTDIVTYVPAPWQKSYIVHADRLESSAFRFGYANPGTGDGDIEALAFIVMMKASQSA